MCSKLPTISHSRSMLPAVPDFRESCLLSGRAMLLLILYGEQFDILALEYIKLHFVVSGASV